MKFCQRCGCDTERNSRGACKPCSNARVKAWKQANPDRVKELHADYRAKNAEKIKASWEAWNTAHPGRAKEQAAARYAADREGHKAKSAAWEAANREKVNAAHAAWNAANPDKRRAITAAYYATHVDECTARNKAWAEANQEARRAYWQNRQAKKREAGGKLSPDIADKLLKLQRGRCACCGQPLRGKYHLDHIVSIAKGGANVDANIQLLLPKCNREKHAKHPVDFMQSRGSLL
jgi:5-methylcytosine-specific restriction endonuclease McrA